jgi:hypothetical protein
MDLYTRCNVNANTMVNVSINLFYLNLNSSYVYYLEGTIHYICSNSSSRKIKEYLKYVLFLDDNEISKKMNIFAYLKNENKHIYLNCVNLMLESNKRKVFKESLYENKARIKIIGRGWKIIKFPYELLIKLGYSHPIFFSMDPFTKYKLKKKKKKYYTFYGNFYDKLNTIMGKFNFMRIPDLYTRKGIFYRRLVL